MRRSIYVFLIVCALAALSGCNDYRVRFLYPRETQQNFFSDRPVHSMFVADPEDLRPSVERAGRGMIQTLHYPADDKLDRPAAQIVRRALMQDLLQTRVASLVQNPENADYILTSKLLSMTTRQRRPAAAWAFPLVVGAGVGAFGTIDVDASHGIKLGLVGALLGTFIPAPAKTEGVVQMRLELRDRATQELVWSTVCTGAYRKTIRLGITAREDKRIAEEFLPKALKRANACAVGQLYAYFSGDGTGTETQEGR